jgi:hypothetical protein
MAGPAPARCPVVNTGRVRPGDAIRCRFTPGLLHFLGL